MIQVLCYAYIQVYFHPMLIYFEERFSIFYLFVYLFNATFFTTGQFFNLFPVLQLFHLHVTNCLETILQSERSKKAGQAPPTTLLVDSLKALHAGGSDLILLEESINFNERAASLLVSLCLILKCTISCPWSMRFRGF